jgi:hypothetical protein
VTPDRGWTGLADPVHDAGAQYGHRFHQEEAIFDRRTPGVQYQHLQCRILPPTGGFGVTIRRLREAFRYTDDGFRRGPHPVEEMPEATGKYTPRRRDADGLEGR